MILETQSNNVQGEQAAAFLSHDANNLLSVLRGRLELAQETGAEEHFDSMEQAIDRLAAVIDDTVTVLRTGKRVNDLSPVSLEAVTRNAWDAVDVSHASLTIEPMDPILADESRLCQLLENLFRNAVQHAGPDVTVSIGPLNGNCGFYVEDDGPGVDPGWNRYSSNWAHHPTNRILAWGLRSSSKSPRPTVGRFR